MLADDTSAVSSTACSTLVAPRTLEAFEGIQLKTYVFNGGRWFLKKTETVEPSERAGYQCIDISELNTYAVLEPAFKGASFLLAVGVVYVALRLIFGRSI